jgi:hypothetical protein
MDVWPVLPRELVVEAHHLLLAALLVRRHEEQGWLGTACLHGLDGAGVCDDEGVGVVERTLGDEPREVAAIGEAKHVPSREGMSLRRGPQRRLPRGDVRLGPVGGSLVAWPAHDRGVLGRRPACPLPPS